MKYCVTCGANSNHVGRFKADQCELCVSEGVTMWIDRPKPFKRIVRAPKSKSDISDTLCDCGRHLEENRRFCDTCLAERTKANMETFKAKKRFIEQFVINLQP